eukprot:m.93289 g.93289  ORF g.93289 m.93289 type:complete len:62 (+) comp18310_c0_seq4:46-231(+)
MCSLLRTEYFVVDKAGEVVRRYPTGTNLLQQDITLHIASMFLTGSPQPKRKPGPPPRLGDL